MSSACFFPFLLKTLRCRSIRLAAHSSDAFRLLVRLTAYFLHVYLSTKLAKRSHEHFGRIVCVSWSDDHFAPVQVRFRGMSRQQHNRTDQSQTMFYWTDCANHSARWFSLYQGHLSGLTRGWLWGRGWLQSRIQSLGCLPRMSDAIKGSGIIHFFDDLDWSFQWQSKTSASRKVARDTVDTETDEREDRGRQMEVVNVSMWFIQLFFVPNGILDASRRCASSGKGRRKHEVRFKWKRATQTQSKAWEMRVKRKRATQTWVKAPKMCVKRKRATQTKHGHETRSEKVSKDTPLLGVFVSINWRQLHW